MTARTYVLRGRRKARRAAAPLVVGLAGGVVMAVAGFGALDVWTIACGAVAVVLLLVSSVLVLRWPDGPTVFVASIVVTTAVAPQRSAVQVAVLIVAVAGYLLVVDAVQSGAVGAGRGFWMLPQLAPLAIGAATGMLLALASAVRVGVNGWLLAAAGLLASTAAVGVLLLVDHSSPELSESRRAGAR